MMYTYVSNTLGGGGGWRGREKLEEGKGKGERKRARKKVPFTLASAKQAKSTLEGTSLG
jgi:hypothetical protein